MKHLKTFEDENIELLTQMQGLGLAPKPMGFYISLCFWDQNTVDALGVVLIGKSFEAVAEILYSEFGMEDAYENYGKIGVNSIIELMKKFAEDFNDINTSCIYRVWEMKPKTKDADKIIIESETLMEPLVAVELGKEYFEDFEEVMKKNPNGLKD